MTEQEWHHASDPHGMLEFLHSRGCPAARKLRLFAVACSRRMWALLDALGRQAVDVAESFAAGEAGPEELRAARLACQGGGGHAAWYAAATNPAIAARNAARSAQAGAAVLGKANDEMLVQASLLRDIFGNPFQHYSVDSTWLTPDVVKLARAIDAGRAFDRLPELANELAKAGCDHREILNHCRQPGEHVRGCWVVDIVLQIDSDPATCDR